MSSGRSLRTLFRTTCNWVGSDHYADPGKGLSRIFPSVYEDALDVFGILQRTLESIRLADAWRALTEKARAAKFFLGPMLMAALKQAAPASAVGGRDAIVGPVHWLSAGSWRLQRSHVTEVGWRIVGRTKSECSQQGKSHDRREEKEVLFPHLSPPLGHNPKCMLAAQNITRMAQRAPVSQTAGSRFDCFSNAVRL